jgi:uncharacterized protein (TIGR02284 family)
MNDETRSLLNELIETCKDGEQGFTRAAQDVKESNLKTVFTECAGRCHGGASELQTLVRSMGGTPETEGTVKAAMHRGWMDLKTKLTSRDSLAVLEEVERGEDYAKARYAQALKMDLPPNVRDIVQRQSNGAVANHDRIRELRNQYRELAKSA